MQIDSHFPDAVAAFFASGGRITACQDFTPQPRPARSNWVDPDTKLVRRPKKITKPLEVEPERKPPKRYYQPKPSRMNDEAIALIRQYAAEGRSQADAARALHVSDKTVSRVARNLDIQFVTAQSPQTDEQIAEAIRPTDGSRCQPGKNAQYRQVRNGAPAQSHQHALQRVAGCAHGTVTERRSAWPTREACGGLEHERA